VQFYFIIKKTKAEDRRLGWRK